MKLEMILAATDGSPLGTEALRAAARTAAGAGAGLAAVTVAQDPWQWIESWEVEKYRFNLPDPIESVLAPRVRDRLEPGFRAVIGTPPTPHLVRLGVPGVEIARAAELVQADLIVLGRGSEIGRTIEGTVRRAQMPCLVVPSGLQRFQRVLAAVDVRPSSADVLDAALALVEAEGSDVLAFHVEPTLGAAESGLPRHERLRHVDAVSSALHTAWERAPADPSAGVAACELITRRGEPVSEILKAVRDERIDLLVVGCHRGEGGYPSQVIGSRLLRRAPCAVLTVPL
ncbi:MAG TPA: universal stress protein [Gemmatimonadales bacterium]|nr:universal stress protein [Gemmatimonadales bacterium]